MTWKSRLHVAHSAHSDATLQYASTPRGGRRQSDELHAEHADEISTSSGS
jgi:hypothetical protein